MPFSDLENFKVLAEKLNFTRAAESLFMSQSTLSKSIGRLEDKLGFALFTRNTREVELTPAGKSFYKDTVELLDMYEQSVKRAKASSRTNGIVRIGGHFANPKIYSLVDTLRQALDREGTKLDIETNSRHVGSIERKPGMDDPYEDALHGDDDIDLLYMSNTIRSSGLLETKLYKERLFAFVSKDSPLASRNTLTIDDLKGMKWVTTTTYYAFKWTLMDICASHGFEPETRLRVVDSMGDFMRVRSSDEVIVLSDGIASLAPPHEVTGLVRIDLTDEDAFVDISAMTQQNPSNNVLTCLHLLQEVAADW